MFHRIEFFFIKILVILSKYIPKKLIYYICYVIAQCIFIIDSSRRKVTMHNLQKVFPKKSFKQKITLANKAYLNISETMALNLLRLNNRISDKEIMKTMEIEGLDFLESALDSSKTGIMIYTAHIGNWELIPPILSSITGRPVNVIARKFTNPMIENNIIKPMRNRNNVNLIYKKNSIFKIVKGLKRNEIGGILIDQKQKRKEAIDIPFFGHIAPTSPTLAMLQIKYNIIAIPMFMVKNDKGTYKFIIKKPINTNNTNNINSKDIFQLSVKHQQEVEEIINNYPDQWFWMHNRWNIDKKKM